MQDDRRVWESLDTHARRIYAARTLLAAAKASETRGDKRSLPEDQALELVGRAFGLKIKLD